MQHSADQWIPQAPALPSGEADPALDPLLCHKQSDSSLLSPSSGSLLPVPPAVSLWQVQEAVSALVGSIWRGQRACEWCCCISQGLPAVQSLIREQKRLCVGLEVIEPVQADVYFLCSLE